MGCGAFTVVWPYDNSTGGNKYTWLKKFPPPVEKIKKPYSTGDSLVVHYQSTDPAQRCLTSQFGWDAVLSPWYDRMTRASWKSRIWIKKIKLMKKNNFFFFCYSRGLGIVDLLFHQHQASYQMLGVYYLNSIRKSWLAAILHLEILTFSTWWFLLWVNRNPKSGIRNPNLKLFKLF